MFVRVEPQKAGPAALGILVPPGQRTLVIGRPRSLHWDLLPAQWDGSAAHAPRFCTFARDEAVGVARRLIPALESACAKGINPVQSFGKAAEQTLQIWLRADEYVWIVCGRAVGKPYEPAVFSTMEEADAVADSLAKIVFPASEVRQEYYFNTQNFS